MTSRLRAAAFAGCLAIASIASAADGFMREAVGAFESAGYQAEPEGDRH